MNNKPIIAFVIVAVLVIASLSVVTGFAVSKFQINKAMTSTSKTANSLYQPIAIGKKPFIPKTSQGSGSTPPSSTISPLNIAFIRNGDLWIMSHTGSREQQLSAGFTYEYPKWSPQGDIIEVILKGSRPATPVGPITDEIHLIDFRTRSITMNINIYSLLGLITYESELFSVNWDPSGQHLIFTAFGFTKADPNTKLCSVRGGLYMIDADGKNFKVIDESIVTDYDCTNNFEGGGFDDDTCPHQSLYYYSLVSWSTDGNLYAFGKEIDENCNSIDGLFRINLNGQKSKIMNSERLEYLSGLDINCNGNDILYSSGMNTYWIKTDGSGKFLVAGDGPSWSESTDPNDPNYNFIFGDTNPTHAGWATTLGNLNGNYKPLYKGAGQRDWLKPC